MSRIELLLFCALALALAANADKVAARPLSPIFFPSSSEPSMQVIIPYERVASRPANNQFCQAKFTFCPNQSGKRCFKVCCFFV